MLYCEDLEARAKAGCQVPGCTHRHPMEEIWLLPNCHPKAGLSVCFHGGVLFLECRQCKAFVANIAIARKTV